MRVVCSILFALALALPASPAAAQNKPAGKDTKLYFITPRDGATVRGA
ncbi:MAG: hypothetical protein V7632_3043, partial [Bradyrhizobium sp.]